MDAILFLAVWFFVVTHVDTLVVLAAFFLDETYARHEILVGHYLGFGVGLVVAVAGALLVAELLGLWTFLLGVVPLGLGVWGLVSNEPERSHQLEPLDTSTVRRIGIVMSAGIGLSGENLAVFIPFFADLSIGQLFVVVAWYLVLAGVVYVLALTIARTTATRFELPDWIETRLVPVVLVIVGLYVLATGWFVA